MARSGLYAWPLAAAVALTLTAPAFAAVGSEEFVKKASIAGNFEVVSSELALERSQDKDVKTLAQMIIDDHEKAKKELMQAVATSDTDKDLKVEDGLDDTHDALMDRLEKSRDFDADYLKIQKDAHEDAVALFTDYGSSGSNDKLKQFAVRTLPVLKKHLSHVEGLE